MHSLLCDFCSSDQRFARGLVGSPHPASFRFHLTMDTLAFGYILPTTGQIRDLHPLEMCAAGRTNQNRAGGGNQPSPALFWSKHIILLVCFNSQSVISQSLTCQQHADCDLPHVSGGYRFLSARHCRSFSCLQFISPPIEVGESLLYLVEQV